MTRSRLTPFLTLAILATLGGCSLFTPRPVTPIEKVVSASKSDLTTEQILSRVRQSHTTYALKGSDFAELSRLGVPDAVLDELQADFVADVDLMTYYLVRGRGPGGCQRCYPQPVDLANLDHGGDGMAPASRLDYIGNYSRPAGVPDWVPPYPARPFAPRISTDDVLAMAKSGASVDEIVARIRNSRFTPVTESGKYIDIGTRYSPGLKGSELATLSKQGVPDQALDALQAEFLAEYVGMARLDYTR